MPLPPTHSRTGAALAAAEASRDALASAYQSSRDLLHLVLQAQTPTALQAQNPAMPLAQHTHEPPTQAQQAHPPPSTAQALMNMNSEAQQGRASVPGLNMLAHCLEREGEEEGLDAPGAPDVPDVHEGGGMAHCAPSDSSHHPAPSTPKPTPCQSPLAPVQLVAASGGPCKCSWHLSRHLTLLLLVVLLLIPVASVAVLSMLWMRGGAARAGDAGGATPCFSSAPGLPTSVPQQQSRVASHTAKGSVAVENSSAAINHTYKWTDGDSEWVAVPVPQHSLHFLMCHRARASARANHSGGALLQPSRTAHHTTHHADRAADMSGNASPTGPSFQLPAFTHALLHSSMVLAGHHQLDSWADTGIRGNVSNNNNNNSHNYTNSTITTTTTATTTCFQSNSYWMAWAANISGQAILPDVPPPKACPRKVIPQIHHQHSHRHNHRHSHKQSHTHLQNTIIVRAESASSHRPAATNQASAAVRMSGPGSSSSSRGRDWCECTPPRGRAPRAHTLPAALVNVVSPVVAAVAANAIPLGPLGPAAIPLKPTAIPMGPTATSLPSTPPQWDVIPLRPVVIPLGPSAIPIAPTVLPLGPAAIPVGPASGGAFAVVGVSSPSAAEACSNSSGSDELSPQPGMAAVTGGVTEDVGGSGDVTSPRQGWDGARNEGREQARRANERLRREGDGIKVYTSSNSNHRSRGGDGQNATGCERHVHNGRGVGRSACRGEANTGAAGKGRSRVGGHADNAGSESEARKHHHTPRNSSSSSSGGNRKGRRRDSSHSESTNDSTSAGAARHTASTIIAATALHNQAARLRQLAAALRACSRAGGARPPAGGACDVGVLTPQLSSAVSEAVEKLAAMSGWPGCESHGHGRHGCMGPMVVPHAVREAMQLLQAPVWRYLTK